MLEQRREQTASPDAVKEAQRHKLIPAALILAASFFPTRSSSADELPPVQPTTPPAATQVMPPAVLLDASPAVLLDAPPAGAAPISPDGLSRLTAPFLEIAALVREQRSEVGRSEVIREEAPSLIPSLEDLPNVEVRTVPLPVGPQPDDPVPGPQPPAVEPPISNPPVTPPATSPVTNGPGPGDEYVRWDDVMGWLKTGIVGVLVAATALLASLRGVHKGYSEFRDARTARRRFDKNEFLDVVSCNVQNFAEVDGRITTKSCPVANTRLSEFIPNSYAADRFVHAAKCCTDAQPFPMLEFPIDQQVTLLGRVLSYFKEPTTEAQRISGLNRMNKYIRDSFAAHFGEGAMAKASGLPTRDEQFVLVPICDLFPVPKTGKFGKDLIVRAITERDFQNLRDEAFVARIAVEDPRARDMLRILVLAAKRDQEYGALHIRDGQPEQLFPRVEVSIKV